MTPRKPAGSPPPEGGRYRLVGDTTRETAALLEALAVVTGRRNGDILTEGVSRVFEALDEPTRRLVSQMRNRRMRGEEEGAK